MGYSPLGDKRKCIKCLRNLGRWRCIICNARLCGRCKCPSKHGPGTGTLLHKEGTK